MGSASESREETVRAGLCLLSLLSCAFVWAAVWNFDLADWPSAKIAPHNAMVHNACGRAGAWVAYQLFYYLGTGTYALLICASGFLAAWLTRGRVSSMWQRALGTALLVAVTGGATYLVGSGGAARLPIESGGVLGVGLGRFLKSNFHWAGTVLILLYGLVTGVLFAGDGVVTRVPSLLRCMGVRPTAAFAGAGASFLRGVVSVVRSGATAKKPTRKEPVINPGRPLKPEEQRRERPAQEPAGSERPQGQKVEAGEPQGEPADASVRADRAMGEASRGERRGVDGRASGDAARRGSERTDQSKAWPQEEAVMMRPYPAELAEWEFPPIELLDEPEYQYSLEQEAKVRAQANLLEETLEEYRVDAHVVEIDTGPVITMFELQVGPGVKVAQISTLCNDIARALKAPSVRVVAPIPGKNTIGIEVPNVDKEKVRMRELLALAGRKHKEMTLPLYFGKDAGGNPLIGDLAKMPHLLIAGTTGSGKSVCINSIITSLLLTQRPDMAKLILVDPKMVELSAFREIPHLMCPIVTEISRAEAILDWAVTKMEERYELLAEAGVRNVAAYNRLGKEEIYERFAPATPEEKMAIPTHLPHVIIMIDELADLMMTSAKEVEHCLARLAQKSRAVGIHIIVATQRPEARIVTGLIKSNMPCRIAFRVSSRMDSRIVLDQNGAEVLMGQGDMLFLPPGQSKLVRAQGTMVEEHELLKVLEFVKRRGRPDYHPELVRLQRSEQASSTERDELFDEAVEIMLESRRGSVSLLQRRLTIGYSRASRLIDQMAEAGIVGEYKGSQAREVLMTEEEWEAIRANRDREEAREAEETAGPYAGTEGTEAGRSADDEAEELEAGPDGEDEARAGEPRASDQGGAGAAADHGAPMPSRHIVLPPPQERAREFATVGARAGRATNENYEHVEQEEIATEEDEDLDEGEDEDEDEYDEDEEEEEEEAPSPAEAFEFEEEQED